MDTLSCSCSLCNKNIMWYATWAAAQIVITGIMKRQFLCGTGDMLVGPQNLFLKDPKLFVFSFC